MSWKEESGCFPTDAELRAMGIVPPSDYRAWLDSWKNKNEPVAKTADTRLAGLEEALALAQSYHQVGIIEFEAELSRIIKRLKEAAQPLTSTDQSPGATP